MFDGLFKNKTFSIAYPCVLFFLAILIILLNVEIGGAVAFVFIVSAALVMSSRLTDAMLPAMLLAVFVTRCYNSADAFLAVAWAAIPPVFAVIFHFVKYKKKIRIGKSFYGLCAVTVAVTLGGVGTISTSEYFCPTALFYVFGLGIGMVLFYLLVKSQLTDDATEEIVKIMYIVGLLACFCVVRFYFELWDEFCRTHTFVYFRSSNNLATFLMLAMPFPLYYARKRRGDMLVVCLMYICTVFTGSRGGLLMGTIEFAALVVIWIFTLRKNLLKVAACVLIVAVIFVGVSFVMPRAIKLLGISAEYTDDGLNFEVLIEDVKSVFADKYRSGLIKRMVEDFKSNPVFGVGIGYTGNSDIYNPVKGAMNWYHMWFAQVIGGLGIVGILAYGYQAIDRLILFFKNRSYANLIFLISYGGLFLMSQVNPGEFCPMPYAALAVTFFIIMEECSEKTADVSFPSIKKFSKTEKNI